MTPFLFFWFYLMAFGFPGDRAAPCSVNPSCTIPPPPATICQCDGGFPVERGVPVLPVTK